MIDRERSTHPNRVGPGIRDRLHRVLSPTLLALGVVAIGCGRRPSASEIAPVKEDAETKVSVVKSAGRPPPPWPSGVPSAHAPCKTHSECAVLMDAPQTDPCCKHRVFQPVSRAYADWVATFHAAHCGGVVCPTQPLPGPEPSCCVSIGRCVKAKCVLGCDDPTLDAPKVNWLDSACRMPMPP